MSKTQTICFLYIYIYVTLTFTFTFTLHFTFYVTLKSGCFCVMVLLFSVSSSRHFFICERVVVPWSKTNNACSWTSLCIWNPLQHLMKCAHRTKACIAHFTSGLNKVGHIFPVQVQPSFFGSVITLSLCSWFVARHSFRTLNICLSFSLF